MNEDFIFEGKKYITAKQASELTGYTSDYVGQLCRGGKIESRRVGRVWLVSEEAIQNYEKEVAVKVSAMAHAKIQHPSALDTPRFEPQLAIAETSVIREISDAALKHKKRKLPLYPRMLIVGLRGVAVSLVLLVLGYTLSTGIFGTHLAQSNDLGTNESKKEVGTGGMLAAAGSIGKVVTTINSIALAEYRTLRSLVGKEEEKKDLESNEAPCLIADGIASTSCNHQIPQAIAVVPSSGSAQKDEVIKTTLQESFSDEVKIWSDEKGGSGIIQPVFKKSSGDNFVYVVVPLKGK